MPIKIPNQLPAAHILEGENIFVMDADRAYSQDIRPLKILILNLMPIKYITETQLLRLLGNSSLQVEVDFIYTESYTPSHTPMDYLAQFYGTFDEVRHKKYDGMIITGAPVEDMSFEEVAYWDEVAEIMEWSKTHVYSVFHICLGAQAGLYYHYGVPKYQVPEKIFGVYKHHLCVKHEKLLRGFDDEFQSPHSRYTEVKAADISHLNDLEILSCGEEVGLSILASKNLREVYSFGHLEYDRDTLAKEYQRDCLAGKNPHIPENYFRNDDPSTRPALSWNLPAAQFFTNWINYAVYQETPYDWKLFEDSALSASL